MKFHIALYIQVFLKFGKLKKTRIRGGNPQKRGLANELTPEDAALCVGERPRIEFRSQDRVFEDSLHEF